MEGVHLQRVQLQLQLLHDPPLNYEMNVAPPMDEPAAKSAWPRFERQDNFCRAGERLRRNRTAQTGELLPASAEAKPLVGGARRAGLPYRVPEGCASGGTAARRVKSELAIKHTAAAGRVI